MSDRPSENDPGPKEKQTEHQREKEWFESLDYNTRKNYEVAYEYSKEQRAEVLDAWGRVERKIELVLGASATFGGWLSLNQDKHHIPQMWISVSGVLCVAAAFLSGYALVKWRRPMSGSLKTIIKFTEGDKNVKALVAAHTHTMSAQYRELLSERAYLMRIACGLLGAAILTASVSAITR
ncbi:MAG: hypothetical protein U0929_20365 [Planctomycetaceae bacterium]